MHVGLGSSHLPQLTSEPPPGDMRSKSAGEHSWIWPSSLKQAPSLLTLQKQLPFSSEHSWVYPLPMRQTPLPGSHTRAPLELPSPSPPPHADVKATDETRASESVRKSCEAAILDDQRIARAEGSDSSERCPPRDVGNDDREGDRAGESSDLRVRCRQLDMRESSAATALALRSTCSCAWIAAVEAHHAAIRSSSHSSMKAENWFQLRVVGVTAIKEPGFGRVFYYRRTPAGRVISSLPTGVSQLRPQIV